MKMSKSILISIKPEYVEKILNGEKILEIRTRIPKEWKDYFNGKGSKPAPSKWYIYCTKNKGKGDCLFKCNSQLSFVVKWAFVDNVKFLNGKVVAEFTLNKIDRTEDHDGWDKKYDIGYALHIDNLVVYDQPKKLSEFKVYDKTYDNVGAFGWAFSDAEKYKPIKRPPQSWCYVEGE